MNTSLRFYDFSDLSDFTEMSKKTVMYNYWDFPILQVQMAPLWVGASRMRNTQLWVMTGRGTKPLTLNFND